MSRSTVISSRRTTFLVCAGIVLIFFFIVPTPRFPADYSTEILDEDGQVLRVFLNRREQWCFAPQDTIPVPEKLRLAVLEFEDRYFFLHPGVNPASMLRAFRQNLRSGEIVSGASTITMQVARLADPKPRTYASKLLELLQAVQLEIRYSKNAILKQYLDHAPYGSNTVGYKAASLRYFGKAPVELTWAEAAALAVLPNAPGLVSPVLNRAALKEKRDRLLERLFARGRMDPGTYRLSLLEPLPAGIRAFPSCAFHLGQRLYGEGGMHGNVVRTTVLKHLQQPAERMLRDRVAGLTPKGIRNGALLVAETSTGKVRVYVGSQDPADANGGQVDGVVAPRSPGSILKPFLYALCMDQGLLVPQTKLRDVPTFYGAFSPSNADRRYAGLVPAKDALVRSLNVPAVRLLYAYGVQPFYLFLRSAGVRTLFRTAEDYGLPLILGGAEVTLWDAADLFRGLALGGRFCPMTVLDGGSGSKRRGNGLIGPGSAYLTLSMLRELKRPGSEFYWERYQSQWPFAWKTGTSYGLKDAWAVGVSPQWTIAVWIGNFNGEGNANLNGASCAGPLLFEIFNMLPKDPDQAWFEKPEGDLETLDLCAGTGYRAGPDCPRTVAALAPRTGKPLKVCPYHKELVVSTDGKYQVCSLCWQEGRTAAVRKTVYPNDVVQYLRENGQLLEAVPPHRPDCTSLEAEGAVQIAYPQENASLFIPRDVDGNLQKVVLRAALRRPESALYWYLDDRYQGDTRIRHLRAVSLSKGWHRLDVVDERGSRSSIRFYADVK